METKKKAEMVRRTTLVKWVQDGGATYEIMSRAKSDPMYLKGYADALKKLSDDFNITPDEFRR